MKGLVLSIMVVFGMCCSAQSVKYDLNKDGNEGIGDVSFLVDYLLQRKVVTYEAVDLGLSVKWATCNVGAESPEEIGLFFEWGETKGYGSDVTDGHSFDWSTYSLCDGSMSSMTKYCMNESDGTVDNRQTLELADDAANKIWGGAWRMPTDAEFTELREKCTWTWKTQNGVNGFVVSGNGNSIFLPANGIRLQNSIEEYNSRGSYWSSSINTAYSYYGRCVDIFSKGAYRNDCSRSCGKAVRPVCK